MSSPRSGPRSPRMAGGGLRASGHFDDDKDKVIHEQVSQQSLVVPLEVDDPGSSPAHDAQERGDDHAAVTDAFPEGGRTAWLCAAGTAGILFCTLGYTNSFGVFQAHYMHHQLAGHSPDDIAWIGSVQGFLIFASGAIGGPVFDRFGAWVIRPAAIAYLASVMLTSICTQYWHFLLTQGILSGISNGLLMFPSMAATPQYFDKKRGAAMGLAIAGSSVGAVVFPIVLSRLLPQVGFGWAVRVCGFIMVPLLLFSSVTVRARLPPRDSRFFLWSAFRKPMYNLLVGAVFFMFIGMFIPLFYLPSYGVYRGMDETMASYLVAVINGASVPGRIVPGILGDKFGRVNTLLVAGVATSVIVFCWPSATTTAGIVAFACFFGLTSGAIISGGSVVFTLCPDSPKDIGTYMGMGIAVASFAVLIGPPINGALLHRYGGFVEVSVFSGVLCMVGAVLCLLAKTQTPQGLWGRI